MTLLLGLLTACSSQAVSPSEADDVSQVRLAEYRLGGSDGQRGTFHYDERGRLVRWELSGPDETSRARVTLYTTHRYAGEVLVGGESFVRKDDDFLRSVDWSYEYDAAGRLTALRQTRLLHLDFRPTRQQFTQRFEYDEQGRLNRIVHDDGSSSSLVHSAEGDVVSETLRTAEGRTLAFNHVYGPGRNPFKPIALHRYNLVTGSWAQRLSEHDLIRTETLVDGESAVVSSIERRVAGYLSSGHPSGWVETIANASSPGEGESFPVSLFYTGLPDRAY